MTYPQPVATDNCPGVMQNVCTPSSGSSFSAGSTMVTCTVTIDRPFPFQFERKTCQFTVNVLDADLSVTNSGPLVITTGQPVMFTLTVRNNGPTGAPGITVIDALPPGLAATSVAVNPAAAATCSGTTTVTCHFPTALASGATAAIVITADGSPSPGTVTNTATISGTASDFNPANNTTAFSLQILAVAPALSLGMLIALAACISAIALLRVR